MKQRQLFISDPCCRFRLAQTDGSVRIFYLSETEFPVFFAAIAHLAQSSHMVPICQYPAGCCGLRQLASRETGSEKKSTGAPGFAVYEYASELTWNVFAGPAIELSRNLTLVAGYRALNVDKEEDDNFEADLTLAGPVVGLAIRF